MEQMTLKKANDILQNPKNHWSHEVDEAKEYVIKAVNILCTNSDFNPWVDVVGKLHDRLYTRDRIIDFLDMKVVDIKADIEGKVCANCKFYDPGWLRCQNDNVARTIRQPLEDACFCYEDYKEEKNGDD